MIGLLARLAPALLAATLGQGPVPSTPGCLPPGTEVSDYATRWFCDHLAAAGKGRLAGPTAYRLVYGPPFGPAKIVEVRQERSGWMIQTTILSGVGGGRPGRIRERRQRWLTADDLLDLEAAVDRSGVWRPSAHVKSKVLDDSAVFLEAIQPGTHRVHMAGATALEGQPLRDLVELLRAMAGIDDLEK